MRALLIAMLVVGTVAMVVRAKEPLNLAIVWHQHQPLYWNRLTGEYELPWVRVHAVQEYLDSPLILLEYPGVQVTFNLQPSLLWQLLDYVEITDEERARGGLYEVIGAVDNHLQWTWALVHDPASLSPAIRAAMQEQFFWLNPYMLRPGGAHYDPYYAQLNVLRGARPLTDGELLDAAGLFLLWQISPEVHGELGLLDLRGRADWTEEGIVRLIRAQHEVLSRVVDAYRAAADLGTELITSPFYHPILPLLAARGWDEDVLGQLHLAQDQHRALFTTPAVGVWPPEQAVSDRAVELLAEAGFRWAVADEWTLASALGRTPTRAELTRPWRFGSIVVLFRDHNLSDKISFAYGNRPTGEAVADFMGEVRQYWEALDRPEQHVVVIAVDGENWMFMAGYPDNGREFLRALYGALLEVDWVNTVTPGGFAACHPAFDDIERIPVGSWAGDLSTWSGEPEEDEAWERLAAARAAVFAGDPNPEALRALYAAEGSDWFWWYGDDQDSGTDDLFDWLFKTHLVAAYRAAGYTDVQIPGVLSLRLQIPLRADLGEAKPALGGRAVDAAEWAEAAVVSGVGAIERAAVAYGDGVLYVRVELKQPARDLIGSEAKLVLYATGRPGDPANVATRHSGDSLGFALVSAVELDLAKLSPDGSGYVFRYAANGRGGWRLASQIRTLTLRAARAGEVIEFGIPFEELGVEPGGSLVLAVTLERKDDLLGQAPSQPLWARIPTLLQGVEVWSMDDPEGDDHGPGTYAYPLNSVFAEKGLFDLLRYAVYDADDRWQLAFEFPNLPNPWNGPQGFSHPLLYLYLDVAPGGRTDSHGEARAAQVTFSGEQPWDYFVKVAGWPAYGRQMWTAAGEGPFLVEVASDPKRGRIIVTIPKSLLPDVRGWHYVLVGSQDGYGANHLRPIGASAGEWTGGGCPDPTWAPQIYDYLAPEGVAQEALLGAYDRGSGRYAVLLPVEVRF